ncbi:divergent polysaccharide deacetylase family protein [Aliiroseovarius lamellibrachiae]|uniref:divergent polysaccharide deacetylase family protein n=1 Tax=Aliiroseovarius lamellibrachiae TaxID=1924933 RepID=UPI001BDFE8A8|nr:divergent polysaccharide deacetylase family protein [Aliiroseovarius lamellibrachiae]MBT2131289.1 divergent polysaccharide deacetylase family protein [Aliiroseovarius lamellibrachiae]
MARGFLSGIAMGVVVSAAGLAGLSVMTAPPNGQGAGADLDMKMSPLPDTVSVDGAGDGAAEIAMSESEKTQQPNPDTAVISQPSDRELTDGAAPAPDSDAPRSESAAVMPSPDEAHTPEVTSAPEDALGDTSGAMVQEVLPAQPAMPTEGSPATQPTGESTEQALTADTPSQPTMDEVPLEAGPVPDTTAPTVAPPVDAPDVAPAVPEASQPVEQPIAQRETSPEMVEDAPTPGVKSAPVKPIGDLAPNVKTNRLPSISDADASEETDAAEAAPDQPLSPLAIIRNASPYERAADLPIMAVLLKDEGGARADLGDLTNLPFPVTFVVDGTAADAVEAVAYYRSQGAEVVVEVMLPPASTPADAEVNFQVQAPIIDQGVAVMMNDVSGFQEDTDLAKQIAQILVASGHGVVSFPKGLSTGNRLAIKAGVPAGTVFRDLDGEGQDGRTIRRFLDNAAFKARQMDGVILFGRARPDTLQALIEWSLGSRAKSVSVAPVSAVLLGE